MACTVTYSVKRVFIKTKIKGQNATVSSAYYRLSQDQMQIFVSPEVIFRGCLSDFILCFLESTDEAVSENVYIGYNILYYRIYFY